MFLPVGGGGGRGSGGGEYSQVNITGMIIEIVEKKTLKVTIMGVAPVNFTPKKLPQSYIKTDDAGKVSI